MHSAWILPVDRIHSIVPITNSNNNSNNSYNNRSNISELLAGRDSNLFGFQAARSEYFQHGCIIRLFFVVAVAVVVAVVVAVADPIRMVLGLIAVNYGAVASMASPLAQHQQQENGQEMTQLNGKEKKWPWN